MDIPLNIWRCGIAEALRPRAFRIDHAPKAQSKTVQFRLFDFHSPCRLRGTTARPDNRRF